MGFSTKLVGELDAIGDWGLLSTDASLTITGWNRWLERHDGRTAGAVLGLSLFDVYPDLLSRKIDRYYRQTLNGQSVILSQRFHKYVVPLAPPKTDNRLDRMQQSTRIVPLVDHDSVCGTVTVIEDVTERVAYEKELRERVEALREADRRKDEFLATLAHELRNPLAPIRNALQIMQLTTDATTVDRARTLIDRQVAHMVRLVDDLMEVSRITRGKVSLQPLRIDIRMVLNAALETSRPLIESAGHELTLSLPDKPLYVDGDLTRLAQVLSNLLNNAAKYTPRKGRVDVSIRQEHMQAVIEVKDTGVGISSEMLPRIFELFTQVDQSLDRSQGGLGIGLALVRKLVEMHGGTVEGFSEGLDMGSRFVVRLPLSQDEKTPGASAPKENLARASVPRRILVVDDNVDAANSLSDLLELMGHTVRTVNDGLAAVTVAKEFRPDVVMMDIGMPGLNGYDACRQIRAERWGKRMTLVAVSGWGQEDDRQRSLEVGFDIHLTKPITSTSLTDVLSPT